MNRRRLLAVAIFLFSLSALLRIIIFDSFPPPDCPPPPTICKPQPTTPPQVPLL
jgi:hypothetical protein